MGISKKTLDLISLALQDRVLTFKEREVIVENATKEGTPPEEINAVLNMQKFSHVYGLWDKKFTVHVADTIFCGEYITSEGDAELSIDVIFDNYISSVFAVIASSYLLVVTDQQGHHIPRIPTFRLNPPTTSASRYVTDEKLRILKYLKDHQKDLRYKVERL